MILVYWYIIAFLIWCIALSWNNGNITLEDIKTLLKVPVTVLIAPFIMLYETVC